MKYQEELSSILRLLGWMWSIRKKLLTVMRRGCHSLCLLRGQLCFTFIVGSQWSVGWDSFIIANSPEDESLNGLKTSEQMENGIFGNSCPKESCKKLPVHLISVYWEVFSLLPYQRSEPFWASTFCQGVLSKESFVSFQHSEGRLETPHLPSFL